MLHTRKEGRKEGRKEALAALTLSLFVAEAMPAQHWSAPFNHNEPHNGYGDFSHPYKPWENLATGYLVNYPTAAGTVIEDPAEVLPPFAWPQPAFTGGPSFNAVHMSLIPKGPYRGMVIVWNRDERIVAQYPIGTGSLTSFQPYAIVDPADVPLGNVRYRNFLLPVGQSQLQDIFCSGHVWSQYGDLIVVGGTDYWTTAGIPYNGGRLTFVWNPRRPVGAWPFGGGPLYDPTMFFGLWEQGPDLEFPRWYPTAMATHRIHRETAVSGGNGPRQRVLVLGGVETVPPPLPSATMQSQNTYEALVVDAEASVGQPGVRVDVFGGQRTWYGASNDPMRVHLEWLGEYPRVHLLSTGEILFSGYAPRWSRLNHEFPGNWSLAPVQPGQPPNTYSSNWQLERHDGTSLLFPNLGGNADVIVRLAGADGITGPTTDSVESLTATPTGTWTSAPSLPPEFGLPDGGRAFANTVILPNGGVLVIGGQWQDGLGSTQPLYQPALFVGGQWVLQPPNPTPSRRTYHSTAVLLPDGRVFLGGGDDRDFDYEIFSPEYILKPEARPANLAWQAPSPIHDPLYGVDLLDYDNRYRLQCDPLPLGHALAKVVLTAPCSTTHHSDMHQRYVELPTSVQGGNQVEFHTPITDAEAPPGIYMLWLVTTTGSVSHAMWVMLP